MSRVRFELCFLQRSRLADAYSTLEQFIQAQRYSSICRHAYPAFFSHIPAIQSEGPSTTVPRRKKIKLDPDSESDRSDERDDPRGKPQTSKGHKAGRDSDGDERVDSEVDDPPRGKAKKREGGDGRPKKEGKKAADRKTVRMADGSLAKGM